MKDKINFDATNSDRYLERKLSHRKEEVVRLILPTFEGHVVCSFKKNSIKENEKQRSNRIDEKKNTRQKKPRPFSAYRQDIQYAVNIKSQTTSIEPNLPFRKVLDFDG
jgi:hypothetical protein